MRSTPPARRPRGPRRSPGCRRPASPQQQAGGAVRSSAVARACAHQINPARAGRGTFGGSSNQTTSLFQPVRRFSAACAIRARRTGAAGAKRRRPATVSPLARAKLLPGLGRHPAARRADRRGRCRPRPSPPGGRRAPAGPRPPPASRTGPPAAHEDRLRAGHSRQRSGDAAGSPRGSRRRPPAITTPASWGRRPQRAGVAVGTAALHLRSQGWFHRRRSPSRSPGGGLRQASVGRRASGSAAGRIAQALRGMPGSLANRPAGRAGGDNQTARGSKALARFGEFGGQPGAGLKLATSELADPIRGRRQSRTQQQPRHRDGRSGIGQRHREQAICAAARAGGQRRKPAVHHRDDVRRQAQRAAARTRPTPAARAPRPGPSSASSRLPGRRRRHRRPPPSTLPAWPTRREVEMDGLGAHRVWAAPARRAASRSRASALPSTTARPSARPAPRRKAPAACRDRG